MKLFAFVLVSATLVLAQPSAPAARKSAGSAVSGASQPDAKAILERAAAAAGGKEAQNSINTQKLIGKLSLPEAGISGTMVIYRSQRGETYQVLDIPGAGKTEAGNNGDVEWERSTLTGPRLVRVASKPGNLLEPDPAAVTAAANYSKIETAGMDRALGKPCYSLHLWPNGGGAMQTACYDRETFLPVKIETGMGAASMKMTLGDYRTVGTVKLPFLLETEAKGQMFRISVESITLNDPLPPQVLELPEEIEKLLDQRETTEVRELEEDKDRPRLRHRDKAPAKAGASGKAAKR